MTHVEVF